ncbi:[acyl-carrier-protein] S-malonyltransferase [Rhizobium sp. BK313]|uniref:acyltransferase domain-containing protein n=1 Tax=Rhizobium sp. BK313 TaxID=2587081 RepID=UPI0010611EC3|nr:acyltransferase domain-containing protein [Rhizobium sp. BK313]MBB3455044.1 [acyl-carrier-protein] S-malonyltransferase [Rhizobium sp. BK313]
MLALLCGGQGLLSANMFDLVGDRPEAAAIFEEATQLLGGDPRELVHGNSDDRLADNHMSQILTVTSTLTIYACIRDILPSQFAVAGYSVGEMAAWSIAGVWTTETALRLTDERARAMNAAGGFGGRLGYVRGLRRPVVQRLAEQHHCSIAIINPGDLFVIGGLETDVVAFCAEALSAGAMRADLLAVKIASHTPLLAAAVAPLRQAFAAATSGGPTAGRLLLAGGDGERVVAATTATAKLAAQVASPIDWATTLEVLSEFGVTHALDLGPGHALAEMAHAALPDVRSYAAEAFHSIEGVRDWIVSQ